jgi:hypothetical protein
VDASERGYFSYLFQPDGASLHDTAIYDSIEPMWLGVISWNPALSQCINPQTISDDTEQYVNKRTHGLDSLVMSAQKDQQRNLVAKYTVVTP